MKKKITILLCSLIFILSHNFAQNLILDDFENGQVSFTAQVNMNPSANKFEIVNTPSNTSGINTSSKCWQFTRNENGIDWAGFWCTLAQNVNTTNYRYVHVKYYRTNANSKLRVMAKVNGTQRDFLPMDNHAPSGINTWENLVFDLESAGIPKGIIEVFGLQPDFSSSLAIGTITYVDDIMFSATETGDDSFSLRTPSGLKAQNVQTTGLDLSWLALQDAVSYDIYKDDVLLEQNVTGTTLNVTGLNEYSLYKFHIVAKNAANEPSLPSSAAYVQTPESKANRDARMAWWREARFGMFIHWGGYATYAGHFGGLNVEGNPAEHPYSRPRYIGDGAYYSEWIMFGARIPRDTYQADVRNSFTAANYNPAEWVRMAKEAGMKYIIVTSKHHEGLSMFDTHAGWNVTDHTVAGRDLMKDLVDEARKAGLKIGFYYSQALDWNNPGGMGWMPQNDGGRGGEWPLTEKTSYVENIVIPHIQTIINKYGVDVIWWDMGEPKYPELQYKTLKAVKDIATAGNIIINNRLEFNIDNGHSGDFDTPEQSIPDVPVTGRADGRDWETCMTMNENWGYCAPEIDNQWKSTEDLILKLIDIASKGGNYLLNIGPKPDGTFPQESIDRLAQVGNWMQVNGEAIYGTIANPIDKAMNWGKITRKIDNDGNTTLYLHVHQWPSSGQLTVPFLNSTPTSASILGNATAITTQAGDNELIIKNLPASPVNTISTTIKLVFQGQPAIGEVTVKPDANNNLTLLPADAKCSGGIMVENTPQNFGGWASNGITGVIPGEITWKIKIEKEGTYDISSECHAAYANTVINLTIGQQKVDLNCAQSNDYIVQNNQGTINLVPGIYDVKVTRTSLSTAWHYLNLRSIMLTYKQGTAINTPEYQEINILSGNGILTLQNVEPGSKIQLYDITGRLITNKTALSSTENIAVNFPTFVVLKLETPDKTHRIIKKVMVK